MLFVVFDASIDVSMETVQTCRVFVSSDDDMEVTEEQAKDAGESISCTESALQNT